MNEEIIEIEYGGGETLIVYRDADEGIVIRKSSISNKIYLTDEEAERLVMVLNKFISGEK